MKKRFLKVALAFGTLLSAPLFGQVAQTPLGLIDPPPSEEICGSAHIHNELMQDPIYAMKQHLIENFTETYAPTKLSGLYRIPIVVHIVYYNTGLGSSLAGITDDQVREAVMNVNKRFRNYNTLGADADIEFVLAVRDQNGNCTTGITRENAQTGMVSTVYNNYVSNGVSVNNGPGISFNEIHNVNQWPSNQYYNIWLVTEFNNNNGGAGVQGYAVFPTSHGTTGDGSVMLANSFLDPDATVFTHEMGHAFNLYHSFEGSFGNSCPSQQNGCGPNAGDCLSETPPHVSSNSTCNPGGMNNCTSPATPNSNFLYNYMDYSSCTDRFTPGQVSRMQAAITGPRASFLQSSGNDKLIPPVGAATATAMRVDKTSVCQGGSVQLFDMTSCSPNDYLNLPNTAAGFTYSWTITNGTQTYNSANQNPVFTPAPGVYNVTFSLTHASYGTITSTSNALFTVLGAATTANMCTPTSQNTGLTGHTVSQVKFNTINSITGVMSSSANQNYICTRNTAVQVGSTYPLTVSIASQQYAEFVEVDIDWNNDGDFADASENAVLSGNVAGNTSNTFTQNILVPATAATGVLLRMRVMGEALSAPSAAKQNCSQSYVIGDVEDYGIYVQPANSAPTPANHPAAATVCVNANTSFTASFNNNPTSYQWQLSTNSGGSWANVNNGGVYSNATTGTLNITGATTGMNGYQYRCVGTNASGSANSNAATLTVNTQATPSFAQIPAFCSGTTAPTLPSTSTNSVSGTWSPATVSNTASGTYTFTPNAGQCATTTTMNITVNPVPSAPTISTSGATTFCQGQSVTLTSSASNGNTWSNGGGTANSITVSTSGTYTVTQTVSGCTSVASNPVTVTVTAPTTPTFNAIPAFCSGTTAPSLPASSTNGINGTWNPAVISNTASGTYTFTPTQGSCATTTTVSVTVNPQPSVSFGAIPELCVYDSPITLTQGTPAGGTYSGNGVSGGQFNPATTGVATTTLTYNYTDGNGCSGTAQSSVVVDDCLGIAEGDVVEFSLYPNPSNGVVTIEAGSVMIQSIHVFDHLGQLVKEINEVNTNKQEVNLSNMASGVYTIRMATEKGIQSIPVVIEK